MVAQELGFGLLFANTAMAIVAYLVVPMAWGMEGAMGSSLETAADWLDLSRAISPSSTARSRARTGPSPSPP